MSHFFIVTPDGTDRNVLVLPGLGKIQEPRRCPDLLPAKSRSGLIFVTKLLANSAQRNDLALRDVMSYLVSATFFTCRIF